MLEFDRVTKLFRSGLSSVRAVDDFSLRVKEGEIVGLAGPNGAGKSTLMHLACGLLLPDEGHVHVLDGSPADSRIREQMNFAAGSWNLFQHLSVRENLLIFANIYGLRSPRERVSQILKEWGLLRLQRKPMLTLSLGQRARVMLCKAWLNEPRLLLLDEPTIALDAAASQDVRALVQEACRARGTSVVLASHNPGLLDSLCDRIVLIVNGRKIAEGNPGNFDWEQRLIELCRRSQ